MTMGERNTYSGKLRNMASLYLRNGSKLLLLFRQGDSIVSNLWIGSAGGHFEKDELNDAKACVLRELYEELTMKEDSLQKLTLRYVTLRHTDGELRQNYYFFADLKTSNHALSSTEGILKWFDLNELDDLQMPFTARHMIDHYVSTGQYNDNLYCGVPVENGLIFTKL